MSDLPSDPFDFTPVPSSSSRHDGWTPEKQRSFIEALASIGVVAAAARAVGMSPKSAYALRTRAGPESGFARVWRAAQKEGRTQAYGLAIERAIKGVATPVFYRGRQVGERRRFNDRLVLAALRFARARKEDDREPWED